MSYDYVSVVVVHHDMVSEPPGGRAIMLLAFQVRFERLPEQTSRRSRSERLLDAHKVSMRSTDVQLERRLLMRRANSEYICMYACMYVYMCICVYTHVSPFKYETHWTL